MKRTSSIKLKAIFLLIVFLLNTVITFACSVGLEMSFNGSHHEGETSGKAHDHGKSHHKAEAIVKPKSLHHHAESNSKPHEHAEKPTDDLAIKHEATHSHENVTGDHHKAGNPDDNCCKDEAIKFGKADKISQKFAKHKIAPAFFPLFVITNSVGSPGNLPKAVVNRKYFVRGHHPPIASIRIAIQSFQI